MKHLKTYRLFESSMELTPEQVKWLDKCTWGTWHPNPRTGLVDVDGNFDCSEQGLGDLKGVRFGVVKKYFDCSYNNLTTLVGAPQKVEGDFSCEYNQLTTLEGAPQEVGGSFSCEYNQLTTLEGAPQKVKGNFWCYDNQLTSLEGAPQKVEGNFGCSGNQLTSLEGAPREVGGTFDCSGNPVSATTLKSIFSLMERGKSYQEALESLWSGIPQEDKILLWRPEFRWVGPEEARALQALQAYGGFKGML